MKNQSSSLRLPALILSCLTPLLAHAQTTANTGAQLEEVVITAERRSTDLQKTAISVAVRDGADLIKEGKSSLAQFLEDIPGVTAVPLAGNAVPDDNPGGAVVIRGVPRNPQPAGGDTGVATTALYTDGVYGGIGADYDLDRIEVLRGPQGTLYGRSATSGVVSIYSRDPVLGEWGGDVNLEYGSFALKHVSGAVNMSANDQFAIRLSGNHLEQNSFLGGKPGGSHGVDAGRIKLLFQPTDDLSVLLGGAYQRSKQDSGGSTARVTAAAPNTIVVTPSAFTVPGESRSRQFWGRLNWDLGFATLTYLPAIRTYNNDSPTVLNAGFFIQTTTNHFNLDQIHTQELRLASNADSKLSWIAGAWYYDRKYKYDQDVIWQPAGAYSHGTRTDKTSNNAAVFGEATYPFSDTLRMTTGLRYDRTKIDSQKTVYVFNLNEGFCTGGIPQNTGTPTCTATSPTFSLPENILTYALPAGLGVRKQNNVTYKLRVEKDLTPTNLIYAMASSGFVPGDIAVTTQRDPATGAPGVAPLVYNAEKLQSYEVGSKNRFLGNTLQFNAAVYYYVYADYQTFANTNTQMGAAPNNVPVSSPARMTGAEFEALWQVTPNDRLGLSAGYTDTRFVDKGAPFATPVTATAYLDKPRFFATFVSQDKIFGIAPLTAQASYDHSFPLPAGASVDVGADARYTSGYDQVAVPVANLSVLPLVKSKGEVVANARVTWVSASDKYSVTGYVRNLTDNVYKTGTNTNGNTTPSEPRIYGVALHAGF